MLYCWKFCAQNERASRVECLSPEFYRHWMLQSQWTCLFSVWLCPQWQQFPKTVGRVECSTLDTNSRRLWWCWQIGVVCRYTGHEFVTKLPKRCMLKYFILASGLIPSTTLWKPERCCSVFQRILCGWSSGLFQDYALQFFKPVRVVIGADVSHDNRECVFHAVWLNTPPDPTGPHRTQPDPTGTTKYRNSKAEDVS